MRVTFEGSGAGSGPLAWGQLDIWSKMPVVDTRLLAPADAEALLWAMERIAVGAAAVPAAGHVEERVVAPTSS
jgi:hypothetical protein